MFSEAVLQKVRNALVSVFGQSAETEFAYIEWISMTLGNSKITSFDDLVNCPAYLWELAEKAKIPLDKTVKRSKQSLGGFIEELAGIWEQKWGLALFDLFKVAHGREIAGDFNFRTNFEEVMFSNHTMVLTTLVAAVVMTTFMYHPNLKGSALFESICSISADSQVILADHFMEIENVAQTLADNVVDDLVVLRSQSVNQTSDHIKLMEKLAKKKDKIRDLKLAVASLTARVHELEALNKEQEMKLHQVSESKADLVNRFKSCSLVFETEEIRHKEEQIEELRRLIEGKECLYKKSVLDFEKNQEELYKKIQVLENFRSKYQNISDRESRLGELQERFQQILVQNNLLKEKCDELRHKIRDIEQENERLLLKSEIFDRSSVRQIATDIKSHISLDFKPEKNTREFYEKSQGLLSEFVDELLVLIQPDKPVLRELKENTADAANARAGPPKVDQKDFVTRLRAVTLRFNEKFASFLAGISEALEKQGQKHSDFEVFKAKSKQRIGRLEDKVKELEGALVENLKLQEPRIQSLCETLKVPENFNETSKSMLNAILTRELEISNLKQARKAALSEFLNLETKYVEQTRMMYAIGVSYLKSQD